MQYSFASPNIDIIQKVLEDYKEFLDQQRARYLKEEKRRKDEEDLKIMGDTLKKTQN